MGGTQSHLFHPQTTPRPPPLHLHPGPHDFIAPRVIELTYTAWDLEPFARDVLAEVGVAQWNAWFPANPVGPDGTPRPFVWDEERRFDLRCDLDALYFHLYEISREDVDYIMETFPIVKRKDEAAVREVPHEGGYPPEVRRPCPGVRPGDAGRSPGEGRESPTGERSSPAARASGLSSRSRYPGTGSGSSATKRWSTPSREPLRPS
jgi:hypothetical protein